MRRTLRKPVEFRGVGLHGGQRVRLVVKPAEPGCGIAFRRTDIGPGRGDVPARYDLVSDTRLCTRLTNVHGISVGTVEHLMAALAGCGITDALCTLDGPEVPIMDGSARPFVEGLLAAGAAEADVPLRAIRVLRPVEVEQQGKAARLEPADRMSFRFRIVFDDPAIGEQQMSLDLKGNAFPAELADCRTFGHLAEVEQLRRLGLARGGGLDNAIVVDRGRVLNPDGLRHPDEFVRHKILDAVGDLALAGAPILGLYTGDRAGHEMTNLLLRALFADEGAWEWTEMPDDVGVGRALYLPEPEQAAALAI